MSRYKFNNSTFRGTVVIPSKLIGEGADWKPITDHLQNQIDGIEHDLAEMKDNIKTWYEGEFTTLKKDEAALGEQVSNLQHDLSEIKQNFVPKDQLATKEWVLEQLKPQVGTVKFKEFKIEHTQKDIKSLEKVKVNIDQEIIQALREGRATWSIRGGNSYPSFFLFDNLEDNAFNATLKMEYAEPLYFYITFTWGAK